MWFGRLAAGEGAGRERQVGDKYSLGNGNSGDTGIAARAVSRAHPRRGPVEPDSTGLCSGVGPGGVGMWCDQLATGKSIDKIQQMVSGRSSGNGNSSNAGAVV